MEELRAIADAWQKNVILEGLGTANFMPFRTIKSAERAEKLEHLDAEHEREHIDKHL